MELVPKRMSSKEILKFFAIRTPRFARTFSTGNPPSHAEGAFPQNCMVEQPRNQVSEKLFAEFITLRHFKVGKRASRPTCCSSNFLADAMLWIKEMEMVDSVDDLTTSQSIGGHTFPNFEILDAKSASALK